MMASIADNSYVASLFFCGACQKFSEEFISELLLILAQVCLVLGGGSHIWLTYSVFLVLCT